MLIYVFVSDKQLENGIRSHVHGGMIAHKFLLCVICVRLYTPVCVHICGYMLCANMNMHLVFIVHGNHNWKD